MSRKKERKRIIHKTSTLEIFSCLRSMPSFSKPLLEQSREKPYVDFLRWLIDKNFYKDQTKKITIKRISADFGTEPIKVTKWIKEIYEQIFELNYEKPELFQDHGVKVCIEMKHYDNYCSIYVSLPVLPREFETFRFPFVQGKIGTWLFWVKKVEHEIIDGATNTTLSLEGGILNKYREFAIDKAMFQGWINYMDVYELHTFELDDELKKIYRT